MQYNHGKRRTGDGCHETDLPGFLPGVPLPCGKMPGYLLQGLGGRCGPGGDGILSVCAGCAGRAAEKRICGAGRGHLLPAGKREMHVPDGGRTLRAAKDVRREGTLQDLRKPSSLSGGIRRDAGDHAFHLLPGGGASAALQAGADLLPDAGDRRSGRYAECARPGALFYAAQRA
ncbi:unknown [Firmicutes bacterium CAG:170]|nr:unknown [Firmicutes bacterium CAG:170]